MSTDAIESQTNPLPARWPVRRELADVYPGVWDSYSMGTETSARGTIQRLRRVWGADYEFKREGNAVLYRRKGSQDDQSHD